MSYKEYSEKLTKIITLVERNAIGRPIELAQKLEISEKRVRRMINHLLQQGKNIQYSRVRQ